MIKKEDVVVDADDDDEMQTLCITEPCDSNTTYMRNTSSGLSMYSSPLLSAERRGGTGYRRSMGHT